MKRKVKRWLLVLLGLCLAGFAVLNVLAYNHARAMMHFTSSGPRTAKPEILTFGQKIRVLFCGVNVPRPTTSMPPTSLSPACRSLKINGSGGVQLGAWYCPRENQDRLVILFHGYSSEKSSTLQEAKTFLKMGLSVLLVDFRGSGDSSESYTTIGFLEAEDVVAAVQYARDHMPDSKVILYGQSMGAAAILRAIYSHGIQPEAVIVEAVFDKMINTVRNRFEAMGLPSFPSAELLVFWGGRQAGFNGFGHNPVQYAAGIKCPILFLHGTEDPRAPVEEARRVFAAVPTRKKFKEFRGSGHESSLAKYPEEWKDTVRRFLESVEMQSGSATAPGIGESRGG